MGAARRQAIYDICVKYGKCCTILQKEKKTADSFGDADIMICEDDPYWALQFDQYEIKEGPTAPPADFSPAEYLGSLEPTFLKLDYQGRVIRLDTFSKVGRPAVNWEGDVLTTR